MSRLPDNIEFSDGPDRDGFDHESRLSPRLQWQTAVRDSDLPTTLRVVAYALAAFMDTEAVCWPSQTKLGDATGLARQTVNRTLTALVLRGWLWRKASVTPQRGGRSIAVWSGAIPSSYTEFPS